MTDPALYTADQVAAMLTTQRKNALEEAARVAERDVDWACFGKKGIEQWDGGPDAVRDYRLGIVAGRSIAATIRALAQKAMEGRE